MSGWLDALVRGAPPGPPPPLPPEPPVPPANALSEQLGEAVATEGNAVELLVCGNEALPAMLECIAGARRHVHLQTMLFFDDEIGRVLHAALAERARAGVEVRVSFELLYTAIGDSTFSKGICPLDVREQVARMRADGLDVRDAAMFPLDLVDRMDRELLLSHLEGLGRLDRRAVPGPLGADLAAADDALLARARGLLESERLSGALEQARAWLRRFPALERALEPVAFLRRFLVHDHRKILVVDGRIGFCGGMNVGREYLFQHPFDAPEEPWEKWRDVHARVEGPAVNRLQRLFLERWLQIGGELGDPSACLPVPHRPGKSRVHVLATTPGDDAIGRRLHREIARSRRIRLTNPYVCREPLIGALLDRARAGAQVDLLVPDAHNDSAVHHGYIRACAGWYRDAGVGARELLGRQTHAKVGVFDEERALIGSYNLNNRSADVDFECALLVEEPAFAREVSRRVFDEPAARPLEGPSGLAELERALACRDVVELFPDVF